jgi:hypothetical protein
MISFRFLEGDRTEPGLLRFYTKTMESELATVPRRVHGSVRHGKRWRMTTQRGRPMSGSGVGLAPLLGRVSRVRPLPELG